MTNEWCGILLTVVIIAVAVALSTYGAYLLIHDGNATGATVVFVAAAYCWGVAMFSAAAMMVTFSDAGLWS
jgi:hypothetical protein